MKLRKSHDQRSAPVAQAQLVDTNVWTAVRSNVGKSTRLEVDVFLNLHVDRISSSPSLHALRGALGDK